MDCTHTVCSEYLPPIIFLNVIIYFMLAVLNDIKTPQNRENNLENWRCFKVLKEYLQNTCFKYLT